MFNLLLWTLLGYLLGSFSPGYFFGKTVKNIDISGAAGGGTGATNVYRRIGPAYGIITAAIDAAKSAAVYLAAVVIGRVDPNLALVPGLAAVAGHVWPFYLNFCGGRGMSSLGGLLFAAVFFTQSAYLLFLLVATVIYSIALSRPAKGARSGTETASWRHALKLAALALPLWYIVAPRTLILAVVGFLLALSLAFDIVRFASKKINETYLRIARLAKPKERKRLSGYSLFLLGAFLVIFFFFKTIAVSSLIFFILGDALAPLGQKFLPAPILKDRTVGGFCIIFGASIAAGIFLRSLTPLPITTPIIILGAFFTAFLDLFSFILDDNLLVPFGTALLLGAIFR